MRYRAWMYDCGAERAVRKWQGSTLRLGGHRLCFSLKTNVDIWVELRRYTSAWIERQLATLINRERLRHLNKDYNNRTNWYPINQAHNSTQHVQPVTNEQCQKRNANDPDINCGNHHNQQLNTKPDWMKNCQTNQAESYEDIHGDTEHLRILLKCERRCLVWIL